VVWVPSLSLLAVALNIPRILAVFESLIPRRGFLVDFNNKIAILRCIKNMVFGTLL